MADSFVPYGSSSTRPALDPSLYVLEGSQLAFYQSQTGIQDEDQLEAHVLAVQSKAYDIYGYSCIRGFNFLRLKISKLSGYKHVLKIGKERPGVILLDIGCCFGNDIRRAVQDGFPVEGIIESDLREETFPAAFVAGDAFDPSFIARRETFEEVPNSAAPNLTSLQGYVSAIHAPAFFHLFNEEKQFELAKQITALLSPLPGSIILGAHTALPVNGFRKGNTVMLGMFCHSPESWKELWDRQIFEKGKVLVDCDLKEMERARRFYTLSWCVTRL
ncbi:hypothetical protein C8J56DRAFT_1004084 [Mycena floridula]|nr:hypothetical protein C8J56DRAFT_1004084 [Mycena floridula]